MLEGADLVASPPGAREAPPPAQATARGTTMIGTERKNDLRRGPSVRVRPGHGRIGVGDGKAREPSRNGQSSELSSS